MSSWLELQFGRTLEGTPEASCVGWCASRPECLGGNWNTNGACVLMGEASFAQIGGTSETVVPSNTLSSNTAFLVRMSAGDPVLVDDDFFDDILIDDIVMPPIDDPGLDDTINDPVNDPPINDPPINDPPINDPPINDPPINDPPVNDPPLNDPTDDTPSCGGACATTADCNCGETCRLDSSGAGTCGSMAEDECAAGEALNDIIVVMRDGYEEVAMANLHDDGRPADYTVDGTEYWVLDNPNDRHFGKCAGTEATD